MSKEPKHNGEPIALAMTVEDELFEHPIVQAHVERALAPYRPLLPPEALEAFRRMLLAMLTTHPEVAPVMERLRRLTPPDRSGTRPVGGGGAR